MYLSILELLNLFKKRKEKKHDFILRQTNNNKSRQFLNSYIKLFNQVISYRLPTTFGKFRCLQFKRPRPTLYDRPAHKRYMQIRMHVPHNN